VSAFARGYGEQMRLPYNSLEFLAPMAGSPRGRMWVGHTAAGPGGLGGTSRFWGAIPHRADMWRSETKGKKGERSGGRVARMRFVHGEE
jgi:hypothetical protein